MNAPYTSGPPNAKILLVGEAPGQEEADHGGAFIGAAGQLLTGLMASAGISRQACRLDNVFQFHPPRNDITPWLDLGKKPVKESPEYRENREALLQRIEASPANIIVALGGVPAYALTGKLGITKQRGSIYQPDCVKGRKVLCTIHPSAALREYLFRYWITADLQLALAESAAPDRLMPERELTLLPSYTEALDFLDYASSQQLASYDIETKGHELSHFSLAVTPTLGMCIPFIDGGNDYWTPDQELGILRKIAEFLRAPGVTKIGQNLCFDVGFLYSKYGMIASPIHDTMIAQGILFPEFPKGLDFLTSIYCHGEPYYKDDGKEWFRNPFGDEQTFRRYSAMDSAVLMEIWPQQEHDLRRQGNWDTYLNQKRLIYPLVYASYTGIQMDIPGLRKAAEGCTQRITSLKEELLSYTGTPINTDSPKQVQAYFYIHKKLRPHTTQGRITSDDKALKQIAAKGHPEAGIILKLRHEQKLLGTYYQVKLDPDNRLRCSYNPVGTKQGRISSSKTIRGTGMNAQNMPPDMNSLMLPDPGYILINQDLGQAENRVVAYVAGEPQMMHAFENGIDIHKQTAALIFGIDIKAVTSDQRQDGKKANHALNYAMSAQGFALHYTLPLSQAKWICDRYHQVYPGLKDWHSAIRDDLSRNNRTLTNCYGRKRTFMDRWGQELFNEAYSYIPQSSVADKMNRDGVCHLYYSQDLYPEAILLNTIHDSIRYQLPLSIGLPRIIEIILSVKANLERPISWKGREFSIPTDTELGFSYDKGKMLEWKASRLHTTPPDTLVEELTRYVSECGKLA